MACTRGSPPRRRQVAEAVRAWRELFPRVVGLKMFAGQSTGNMGIVRPGRAGRRVPDARADGLHRGPRRALREGGAAEARGVGPLAPHQPRQGPAARSGGGLGGRPGAARRGRRFAGTLHVCHISTPWALDVLRGTHAKADGTPAPADRKVRVSCGLTPHHALLDLELMDGPGGLALKCNPPLRPRPLPGPHARAPGSRRYRLDRDRPRPPRAGREGGPVPRVGHPGAALLPPVRAPAARRGA